MCTASTTEGMRWSECGWMEWQMRYCTVLYVSCMRELWASHSQPSVHLTNLNGLICFYVWSDPSLSYENNGCFTMRELMTGSHENYVLFEWQKYQLNNLSYATKLGLGLSFLPLIRWCSSPWQLQGFPFGCVPGDVTYLCVLSVSQYLTN